VSKKSIAVVGAGVYGLYSALILAEAGHEVQIFEKAPMPVSKASLLNQSRIHCGLHYPRALRTAARCQKNYLRFKNDFKNSIHENFVSIYAIAINGQVTSSKFERFADLLDIRIKKDENLRKKGFNSRLVSAVYEVEEVAYDANILREELMSITNELGVKFNFNIMVKNIRITKNGNNEQCEIDISGHLEKFDLCINATYGELRVNSEGKLKYEVCELMRVKLENEIKDLAVTVVDGPFWSLTPWPAFTSSILTHVKFTPIANFQSYQLALDFLGARQHQTQFDLVKRDVIRYFPAGEGITHIGSEYSIKTILGLNEYNDARPIIIDRTGPVLSVIGSKIDNIYDIEEEILNFAN